MAGHGGPGATALFAAAGAGAPRVPPAGERCVGPGSGGWGPSEALSPPPLSSGALPASAAPGVPGEPDPGRGPLSPGESGARSARRLFRRPFPRLTPRLPLPPPAPGSSLRVVALRQHFPCRSLFHSLWR